ncbi:hypothetical protein BVRB_5g125410 [Beta vulgaris subsp. vulgaris]|uniref:Aminotransferase-like plant mobile domain-containing protein n=1 Tax=Beta vulgaris subsp. vulgaris TaxID=3555 RepID=A0A0J8BC47_BETVV|nr:hypothetical protein BVRB_5g125410 [Beta vulgaris subsp. vulgaris]
MTDCHSSNVARNISFEIQLEDTVGDERPPRGRDMPSAAVRPSGGSRGPVIQENLDRPVTTSHLKNVLKDFQAGMAAVMEEQIKNNMLFFQVNPGQDVTLPLRGQSQEGRPGPRRPPRQESTKPLSKGKQSAVSEPRRKMDWKLVVRPGDNSPLSGHKMETDAREYLEAKKAASLQRSASGSTPYMKDPPLRIPSRTEGRSQRPSVVQPRQEKVVLQPMVYRRQALANTSSNPMLKEYCREHIPTEGHLETKKVEETIQPKKSIPKKAETWAVTSMTTSSRRSKRSEPASSTEPIEFSKDQYSILMEIKDQYELKAPAEMKTPYRNRYKSKYCHFHKDCGHQTNEYKHLNRALEDLARKGKMNSYLPRVNRKFQKKYNRQGRRKDDESTDEDVVLVISGGFAAGSPTNHGHKNYLHELSQIGSQYGDQQAARECYLTTLKPSSWKGEKSERPKAIEEEPAEIVKGQISELKNEVGKAQVKDAQEGRPSILLPTKKRKCQAIKEEKASLEEVMAIMGMGLEHPEPVERPVEICLSKERQERTLKIGSVLDRASTLLFPLVRDLVSVKSYSWASVALAYLYRELGKATRVETKHLAGSSTLLEVWIYENFPMFRPMTNSNYLPGEHPRAMKWYAQTPTPKLLSTLQQHRWRLDDMTTQEVYIYIFV